MKMPDPVNGTGQHRLLPSARCALVYGDGETTSDGISDGISDGMSIVGVGTVRSGEAPPSVGVQAAIAAPMASTASSRFNMVFLTGFLNDRGGQRQVDRGSIDRR
jgi:hypothetical protein